MRVLIYAPAARMGGARAHVLGLVPELAAIAPSDEVLLIAQPDLLADLPALPSTWTCRAERAETRGVLRRIAWEQLILPRTAARWKADVLLSFGSFVPLRASFPTVLEAANALPFTRTYWRVLEEQPVGFQVEERLRWVLLCASLRACTRVITPTRAMRQEVATTLRDLGPKVDVVLWGVASIFHALRWSSPADEIVLAVSKHGINKEFDVLVRALPELIERWPNLQLRMTGSVDESRWSRRTMAVARRLGIAERICFAGDVPNAQIPALIQQSRVLVFPTWSESFGLPLAEALAMGAPAVAADIPACREVGADGASYYAQGDSQSLARAIGDLVESPPATAALAERAYARGRTFSWRDNAVGVRQSLVRALN